MRLLTSSTYTQTNKYFRLLDMTRQKTDTSCEKFTVLKKSSMLNVLSAVSVMLSCCSKKKNSLGYLKWTPVAPDTQSL